MCRYLLFVTHSASTFLASSDRVTRRRGEIFKSIFCSFFFFCFFQLSEFCGIFGLLGVSRIPDLPASPY